MRRLMAVLARDSPLRARLRMDAWLEQLLYIAADAAATVRPRLFSPEAFDTVRSLVGAGRIRRGFGKDVRPCSSCIFRRMRNLSPVSALSNATCQQREAVVHCIVFTSQLMRMTLSCLYY